MDFPMAGGAVEKNKRLEKIKPVVDRYCDPSGLLETLKEFDVFGETDQRSVGHVSLQTPACL